MDDDSLDIGQLRVFNALFEHRSVIKVSRVLDIPQPTVSRWLSRLRVSFGDPLFVRTQHGMEPTPTAMACADAVASILSIHRTQLLHAGRFDPPTTTRNFKIAASDFGHLLVVSNLHRWSKEVAPLARFTAIPLGRKPLITHLEQGEADLAIGGFPDLVAGVKEQTLFDDHYVCVMRTEHPLSRENLTLDAFYAAKHILVRAHNIGHVQQDVEQLLTEMLPPRNIRLVSESIVVAMMLIGKSDLVLTTPSRVAAFFSERQCLVAAPAPMDLPRFQVKQYWHERFDNDPGNQWLRKGVSLLRTLTNSPPINGPEDRTVGAAASSGLIDTGIS